MKKAYKIVTDILLILLLLLAAALFLPSVFGLKPLAVLSGSMEPTYHVGSLIYVQTVEPEEIEVGDPMTYKISQDTMVTHRVVEKNEEEQYFQTKGDANETEDGGTVSYTNVVGKPAFTIPFLGYIAVYASTKSGMMMLITIIVAVLLLTILPDLLMGGKKSKEKEV